VNYWKVILATVVIFGAGVLTGGLLVNYVNHPHAKNPHHASGTNAAHPSSVGPDQSRSQDAPIPRLAREMGRQFVEQLDEQLQLTPEQHARIEKIVADGQERNREIWTNVAPKMHAVLREVNQQIRAELTPEQLKPFDELLKHSLHHPASGTNAPPVPGLSTNGPPPAPANAPGV
jgi:Spy/CpxP family protein refolding chaperone